MKAKHRILISYDYFIPGFKAGGIVQSCKRLIENLGDYFSFFVITKNTDLGDTQPYPGIESNKWVKLEQNCQVIYLSRKTLNLFSFIKIYYNTPYDVLYLHSLYSFYFTVIPLLVDKFKKGTKVVLAPRGMLQEGALSQKGIKKQVYIFILKHTFLLKGVTWHGTDDQEIHDIKKTFGNVRFGLASNFPVSPLKDGKSVIKTQGELRLVYISLITKKKNLHFLLECLKGMKGKITLDIYGPIVDKYYWENCCETIKFLTPNINVEYKGLLENRIVQETLVNYHFFILPTLGENFGHAIVEAFSASRPVIISNKTPWVNLYENYAGWDVDLEKSTDLKMVIEKAVQLNQEEFDHFCLCSGVFYSRIINRSELIEKYQKLFS